MKAPAMTQATSVPAIVISNLEPLYFSAKRAGSTLMSRKREVMSISPPNKKNTSGILVMKPFPVASLSCWSMKDVIILATSKIICTLLKKTMRR